MSSNIKVNTILKRFRCVVNNSPMAGIENRKELINTFIKIPLYQRDEMKLGQNVIELFLQQCIHQLM